MKMDTYKISKAFHWTNGTELTIESENLYYRELNDKMSGCQTGNLKASDAIHKKCNQIADLIRDIEKLNNVKRGIISVMKTKAKGCEINTTDTNTIVGKV